MSSRLFNVSGFGRGCAWCFSLKELACHKYLLSTKAGLSLTSKRKEIKKKGGKKERKKREDETNPSAPLSSRLYKTIPTKRIAQSSHCSHIPLSWCKITKRIKYQNKKAEWPEDLFCKLHGKQRLVSGYATPTWTVKVISRQNLFTVPVMRHCLWRGNTKQITKVR